MEEERNGARACQMVLEPKGADRWMVWSVVHQCVGVGARESISFLIKMTQPSKDWLQIGG